MNFSLTNVEVRTIFVRLLIVNVLALTLGCVFAMLKLLPVSTASCFIYSFTVTLSIWLYVDLSGLCLFYSQIQQSKVTWHRLFSAGVAAVIGFCVGVTLADEYIGFSAFGLMRTNPIHFFGMVLLVATVASTTILWLINLGQSENTKNRLSETNLTLLFSQLEPHMLFNTMANLRALIELDPERAMRMVDELNKYLRATLKASRLYWHPLSAELDRLNDYLGLMSVRMGPRLSYAIDCPLELECCPIPALLLQPLVENAIKHGLEPTISGGKIHLLVQKIDAHLLLTVSDTGAGGLPSDLNAMTGFGLSSVRERLKTIYGDQAQLTIVQRESYASSLQIKMPLELKP